MLYLNITSSYKRVPAVRSSTVAPMLNADENIWRAFSEFMATKYPFQILPLQMYTNEMSPKDIRGARATPSVYEKSRQLTNSYCQVTMLQGMKQNEL